MTHPPKTFSCSNWSSNIFYKPIVSDIQSHENNVCDRFVSLEQNSLQLSWETMTYFQPSPLRGSGWKCHCFSLKLRWILFSRDETVANVLFSWLFISVSWADNSIVRPAHELNALRGGRTILLSAQLVASWADNRFVHVSFSRNPQKIAINL